MPCYLKQEAAGSVFQLQRKDEERRAGGAAEGFLQFHRSHVAVVIPAIIRLTLRPWQPQTFFSRAKWKISHADLPVPPLLVTKCETGSVGIKCSGGKFYSFIFLP